MTRDDDALRALADAYAAAGGVPDPRTVAPVPDDQVPDDEAMTPAEFRVVREHLGLSIDWATRVLDVHRDTIRRWEAGKVRIPDGIRLDLERLEADTADLVSAGVETLLDQPEPVLATFFDDDDYHQHHPDQSDRPATWNRAIAARIAQEVPGLSIVYINGSGHETRGVPVDGRRTTSQDHGTSRGH